MAEIFSEDLVAISENIVEDFKNLYESKERYDTIITVGDEQNAEQIYAHSQILCARSSYFRRALSDEWAVKKMVAMFYQILKQMQFLYCGIVDLKGQNDETILGLLITADELLIQSLIDIVQSLLIQNCYTFLQQSPIRMLHFITHYKRFKELNEAYLETICKNPSLLFDSDEFLSLEENIFYQIDPKEFVPEVWEYMDILPKDLIKDVVH
ncbi:16382_t:CDS:2, partial [Racocetra persica]